MEKILKMNFVLILFVLLFVGCGKIERCFQTADGSFECEEVLPASPVPSPVMTPEPIPEPIRNPECVGNQLFGSRDNVWKPKGENQPSLVILLNGLFAEPFECIAELKRGGVESLRYTGFANAAPDGLRQHHRGGRPGGKYTGRVECSDSYQTCVFLHTGRTGERRG